jgi:glycosyltransferase involved in cell wall biosynthesis
MLERLLKFTPPQQPDYQVIVVDDASTGSCVAQLHALEGKFVNVEWIYLTENVGGGGARNAGLEIAKGEYVIFADADDFFLPTFANILDKYRDEHDADIIFCNAISLYNETFLPCSRANPLQRYIKLSETSPQKAELNLRYLFGEPWCRIIKRATIELYSIKFEQRKSHNDTLFTYTLGYFAKNILIEKTAVYCVTRSNKSVSTNNYNGRLENRVKVFSTKNKFLADHKIKIFDNHLLDPFVEAITMRNWPLLKKLFLIANDNGISRYVLYRKLSKTFAYAMLRKLRFS